MARKASTTTKKEESQTPTYTAYSVQNRGGEKKNIWTPIGAAWEHGDKKGFTISLNCLPVNGQITLRTPEAGSE